LVRLFLHELGSLLGLVELAMERRRVVVEVEVQEEVVRVVLLEEAAVGDQEAAVLVVLVLDYQPAGLGSLLLLLWDLGCLQC
jgi:hypothetical protein